MATPTPLTTVFTPPSECLSTIFWSSGGQYQLGYSTECIPSGPSPTLSSYFSPGLYCPESYTVACTDLVILGATSTETQAVCCPRLDGVAGGRFAEASFRCNTDKAMPWYSSLGCTMNFGTAATEGPITALYTKSATTYTTTYSAAASDGLNAYSVKLAWQASDLDELSTASATASASESPSVALGSTSSFSAASSTATGNASSDGQSVLTAPASDASSSTAGSSVADGALGTSAKIAIGVAVPLSVITLIILGILFVKKGRSGRKGRAHVDQSNINTSSKYMQEKSTGLLSELDGQARSEMDSGMVRRPQELDGSGSGVGDWRESANVRKAY